MKDAFIEDISLLYVEDDKDTSSEVEYFLKKRFKNVSIAYNGKEAFEIYEKTKPDIIISDIKMPIMTGLQMSSKIREKDNETQIIITSAYSDAKYLDDAISIGINTFLLKPLNLTQLFCTIKIASENILLKRRNEKTKYKLSQTQEQLIESDKMANLGHLVAGVTHEINTPIGIGLTSVSHLYDITKEIEEQYNNDTMTEEYFQSYLNNCLELSKMTYLNLDRSSHLIRSFKKVAVDQTHEEKRVFKLKEYLEELMFSLSYTVKKTKLEINLIAKEEIEISSYPGAFSQIITNFVMNSLKHAFNKDEEGQINIEIYKDQGFLFLKYEDDGRGISTELKEKIFKPFFTTKKDSGGTGLGLSIVKNIVEVKLKASIECLDNKKGLAFLIKIPLITNI